MGTAAVIILSLPASLSPDRPVAYGAVITQPPPPRRPLRFGVPILSCTRKTVQTTSKVGTTSS